jgi:Rrf2 family protein
MSLLFSRRCELALQAVLFVAQRRDGRLTSIKELTTALGIPYHFVAKILQDLSQKGLLLSHKGPKGGFALGMRAEDITLFQIIEAIDGTGFTRNCVLGFQECNDRNRCALHEKWAACRDGVYEMLVGKSVQELSADMRKPGYDRRKRSSAKRTRKR